LSSPAPADPEQDEEIVQLIRSGSEEGVCQLLEAYGARVKGALWTMLKSHQSRQGEIEDAVMDACLSFCLNIESFDRRKGTLFNWLVGAARNNYFTMLREERVRPLLECLDLDDLDGRPATGGNAVPRSVHHGRLLESLWGCIEKLGPMQRDIVLSDLAGQGSVRDAELAKKWNTSANSIRVSRHKAHKRLGKLMKGVRV
jgi:RNA polymerase sigma factor (sigma-70 family)